MKTFTDWLLNLSISLPPVARTIYMLICKAWTEASNSHVIQIYIYIYYTLNNKTSVLQTRHSGTLDKKNISLFDIFEFFHEMISQWPAHWKQANRVYEYHNESKQIMIFLYATIVNKYLQDSKFRHFYIRATCHTLRIPKYFAIENKTKEGSPFTINPSYNNDCEKVDDRRIILMVRMKKKKKKKIQ